MKLNKKFLVWCLERYAPSLTIRHRAIKSLRSGGPELKLLPVLCERDKTSFDIGASIGVYTYFLKRYSRDVVAFEPNPSSAALLQQSFRDRVIVEDCALSDHHGHADLRTPIYAGIEHPGLASIEGSVGKYYSEMRAIRVALRMIDDFQDRRVGFIKIDVEGHELSVLHGGKNLIQRDRPSFIIEAEERHRFGAIKTIEDFFEQIDYKGFYLYGERFAPIQDFDSQALQNLANIDVEDKVPGKIYINNFIFIGRLDAMARFEHLL
jgi:FkbM family methyltransferase